MAFARIVCSDSVVNVCAKRSRFGLGWGSARRLPVRTKATDRKATPNHFLSFSLVRIPPFENETCRWWLGSSDGSFFRRVKKMRARRSEGGAIFSARRYTGGGAEAVVQLMDPGREME